MEKAIFLSMSADDLEEIIRRIIKEEIAQVRHPIDDKQILSFEEALVYTGFSESYMYKLTSGRRIPHYKPTGRTLFFNRNELDAWLLSNRIKTADELEVEASTYISRHPIKR